MIRCLISGYWSLSKCYVPYRDKSDLLYMVDLPFGLEQQSLMENSSVWLFVYIFPL